MESHQIIKESVQDLGIKYVAAELKVSPSLLYKWCEPREYSDSGTANPLDRVADLYRITGDPRLIAWACQQMDCFPVRNPPAAKAPLPNSLIKSTQIILREFSDLLEDVSDSIEDDGSVDTKEAKAIREHWERLKHLTESFIVSCEAGHYNINGPKEPTAPAPCKKG